MKCNACWRELEGRAVATTCGHLFCIEDAGKILSNDAACPICDQVLSKSHMKSVDLNPTEEWLNMVTVGISTQHLMKTIYRSTEFLKGQKEVEMQHKMNRIMAQCRHQCEMMHAKFTEKLEQVSTAYQKMGKKFQMLEQENENLSKNMQELHDKFSEKSRQKRKLEEMYDQLKSEYESVKRSAIQPSNNFFPRGEPDLFSTHANIIDSRDSMRKDGLIFPPGTPGPREDIWPTRQNSSNSGHFDIGSSPAKQAPIPIDTEHRRPGAHHGFGAGASNPSMTLRNLILSPIKRPQNSRSRHHMFTL